LLVALFAPSAVSVRALHVTRVHIPHFYLVPGMENLDSLRREQVVWERKARKALERQVAPLEDEGFVVESEVASGSPLAEVRKRAERWRTDLILARPRRGRIGSGLGSVAVGLIQTAPAPVLLYRSVPAEFRVRTVLAPVDFSPFSRKALDWALLLASLARASVRLLHVLPETSKRWAPRLRRTAVEMVVEERRRAERRIRKFGGAAVSVEGLVVERADPAAAVLESQKERIDVVVLGSSGKTGMASVLGSVARRIARECPCPVLVLPTTNRISARDVWRKSRL
jgi:universal stress protein A